MNHSNGLSLAINTSELDTMALSLRNVVKHSSPDAIEAIGSMVAFLEKKARATILGGVAVEPCIAVGLNYPEQIEPSQVFSDGEAGFVGRFASVKLVDFTPALERDKMVAASLIPGDEVITHGLVFATDSALEDSFEGNLGVASLMPYVAVLPGSLYKITRLTV